MKNVVGSALLACALVSGVAVAATYPERPVNVVMGFPAGQSVDVAARIVMEQVANRLKTPFVMTNKPGAGGIIGTDFVAKSPSDGYTLLFGSSSSLVINTALYKSLPYNTLRDFHPVSRVAGAPMFLAVNADLPVTNLAEFVQYVKERPGQLNYASAGNGLTNHLIMEMFKARTGLDIVHVPYKGSAAGLADLVGGRVQAMFDAGPGALPLYQQGKIRVIAVSSAKRSRAAPEVPTLSEQGVDVAAEGWVGLMAPAGTPTEVVKTLDDTIKAALSDPRISDRLVTLGFEPEHIGSEAFKRAIEADQPVWSKAVKESGATVD